jgi:hypothetical protein
MPGLSTTPSVVGAITDRQNPPEQTGKARSWVEDLQGNVAVGSRIRLPMGEGKP